MCQSVPHPFGEGYTEQDPCLCFHEYGALSLPLIGQNANPTVWADGKSVGQAQTAILVIVKPKDPHLFPHQKQYPLKPEVKEGLIAIIENLKEQGLLIPCNSPYNTPILGVEKLNDKWRLVQDLQITNEAVVPFTHMPKTNGFSCLQVYVINFLYPFLYFNKTLLYKTLQ